MSNKARLKKKSVAGANLRNKTRLSAKQRTILSQTIQTARHFHQEGNFQLAEEYYRQVLTADPTNPNANNFLGILYYQTGNITAALPLVEKAVQVQPGNAEALNALGNIHMAEGHYKKAIIHYKRAFALQPAYAEAHFNQGAAFLNLGKIDDAITSYSVALILKPNFTKAYHHFSIVMRLHKQIPNSIGSPDDRKTILINCLNRTDIEPQIFFYPCLYELFREDILEQVHNFISNEEDFDSYLHDITSAPLNKLLSEQLFLLMLKKTVIVDRLTETFLTRVRKGLAMLLATSEMDELFYCQMLPVVCAIAQQCFWNEYVFQTTEAEAESILKIKSLLHSTDSLNTPKSGIFLALLGCYAPLATYDIAEKLPLNSTITSQALSELTQVHILETRKEKELFEQIQSFSEIDDEISKQVKHQYEENPYPRWIGLDITSPRPFIDRLKEQITPNSPTDLQAIERPEVLVAGCGTGRQPIGSTTYSNSSVVAIDLSRTSLAYAKRKADELKIDNIEFIQGDILEIPRLNKTFDVIICAGVLHHMRAPEKGFRVLVDMLRPSGYMKIGLYSELARQEIVAGQEFVNNHGFASTVEGIRECRQALFALPDDNEVKQVLDGSTDFYTTSGIRDLLFHVEEHRFTLPEISRLLDKHNLEFLGFTLNKGIKNAYLAEYADDPGLISLANWNSYEIEHPRTFLGMYVFWVRKKKLQES